jgi:hypothetical protein
MIRYPLQHCLRIVPPNPQGKDTGERAHAVAKGTSGRKIANSFRAVLRGPAVDSMPNQKIRTAKEARLREREKAFGRLEPDWLEQWVKKFNIPLLDPEWKCKAALRWMAAHGCDVDLIMNLLAGCTHPKADENFVTLHLKEENRRLLCHLERLKREISDTIAALGAVVTEPSASRFLPLNTRLFSVELPVALESAHKYLVDSKLGIPWLRQTLDNRRLPSGLALIALCVHVRKMSGKTAYSQIADLLEAGYYAHGFDREVDPNSLSRRVRRFREQHRQLAESLQTITSISPLNPGQ